MNRYKVNSNPQNLSSSNDDKCTQCMICLQQMKHIAVLKCGHRFDYHCIKTWAQYCKRLERPSRRHLQSFKCPLCRQSTQIITIIRKPKLKTKSKLKNKKNTNYFNKILKLWKEYRIFNKN